MDKIELYLIILFVLTFLIGLGLGWAFGSSRACPEHYEVKPNLFVQARRTHKIPPEVIIVDNTVQSRKTAPLDDQTLGSVAGGRPDKTFKALVTAYNPVKEQTSGNPRLTASNKWVKEGFIACPRWIPFGTKVELDGKWFECQDRLHPKYDHRFDIFMWSEQRARNWGKQYHTINLYY